jgi:hypothetical protein
MALPERRHFDIKSAAEYLGCSVGDLRHYLDEALLRCTFPTTELEAVDAFDSEKLSQELRAKMDQLPDAPDQNDFEKIRRRIPEVSRCPEFLYVSSYHRKTVLTARNELRKAIYYFESFEGQPLNIWTRGSLDYFWAERGEDGELRDTVLPREELDRFSGVSLERAAIEPNVEGAGDLSLEFKPFSVPQGRVDEIAEAMVAYGNFFYKEKKRIPTSLDLQAFMLERGGKALQLTYDPRGVDFVFSSKPLSKRAFNDRYKQYLVREVTG